MDRLDHAFGAVTVQRKELSGISIGYRLSGWSVTDEDGEIIDQHMLMRKPRVSLTAPNDLKCWKRA
jgi:hypothetical protein